MIFQYSIVGFEWVIGIGLTFGLSLLFNYLTKNDLRTFFIFFFVFTGFMVWAELLPLWSVIISLIFLIIIMYTTKQGGGN